MPKVNNGLRIIDIGSNLVDCMFSGVYNGTKKHEADLPHVLDRAWNAGLQKIIITGTSLEESKLALQVAKTNEKLFSTVGCHPTNCNEFEATGDPSTYLEALVEMCTANKETVVAVGEFGLDYDRLHFASKEIQSKYFEKQLEAYEGLGLPMFLHCRNAADDLVSILCKHRDGITRGVVHSFDGTINNAKAILDLGLYIGINGCSLKTEDNLNVIKTIPSEKLLIETDSPWCEIRPSHAGAKYLQTKFPSLKKEKWQNNMMVKGRNEPCTIINVLEVLAAVREENIQDLGETIFNNTDKLFFSK